MLNERIDEWICTEGECGEASLHLPRPGGGPDGPRLLPNATVRWGLLVTFLLVQNVLNGLSKWTPILL